MSQNLFEQIADGRTDLVFDCVVAGHAATSTDQGGISLLQWCSYHGDVSAIKFLLANGESLQSLGELYGLNAAAFHGHSRLCQFLIEQGAYVDNPQMDTGETPLHAALCTASPFLKPERSTRRRLLGCPGEELALVRPFL